MKVTGRTGFFLAMFFAACVAAAADDGDDFSNNLFSDLAPLLSLFGERVTMQFMSQSMGWSDNIILAMAPLGIVTATVGAIRVGGPSWLKAIIGRARENLAVAEQELMSSTSTEVCELWNGKQVVRCMGSASIAEFICLLPTDMPKAKCVPEIVTSTLDNALREGYLEEVETDIRRNLVGSHHKQASQHPCDGPAIEEGKQPPSSLTPRMIIIRNVSPCAPNISLNSHNQHGRAELWVVAAIGTILQLGVIGYSGFAVYYPVFEFQKNERAIAGYAFPCTALGTLVLILGMLLCSHVIESSTEEKRYRPGHGKQARMVWLQQTKTVSDQVFDSYAVSPTGERRHIVTSRRVNITPGQTSILQLKTTVGAGVCLCGFIVQFVGLRGMHWSATVAQLSAVLVMVGFKAWVRRGLATPPQYKRLVSGFELDWLAMTLRDQCEDLWGPESKPMADLHLDTENWRLGRPEVDEKLHGLNDQTFSNSHSMMKIRRDLGHLADWRGSASEEAIAVARAIEITMDALFHPSHDGQSLLWSLATRNQQLIEFRIERRQKGWKAYSDEIESALSLWLFSVHQLENEGVKHNEEMTSIADPRDDAWLREKGSPAKLSLRVLGPETEALDQDLRWWMPSKTVRSVRIKTGFEEGDAVVKPHRTVGLGPNCLLSSRILGQQSQFKSDELTNRNYTSGNGGPNVSEIRSTQEYDECEPLVLVAESHVPLKLLFAQDMFSAFMWAAAMTQEVFVEGDTDLRLDDIVDVNRWQYFTLQNTKLSTMAQEIKSTGLGSLEDIYLSIIPALSGLHKLPQTDAVIELARKHAKRHEQLQHWQETSDAYLWLFQTARSFPRENSFVAKTTAVVLEFLRQVAAAIKLGEAHLEEQSEIDRLKWLKRTHEEELQDFFGEMLSWIDEEVPHPNPGGDEYPGLHHNTLWSFSKLFGAGHYGSYTSVDYRWFPPEFNFTELHHAVLSNVNREGAHTNIEYAVNVNEKDIREWTPLHYAAARGLEKVVNELLELGADTDSRNLLEWTPLHYACRYKHGDIVQNLLRRYGEVNAQGREGMAPLHCVAIEGTTEIATLLVEAGANVNILDASGKTPLLWAAFKGHKDVFTYLWDGTNKKLRDNSGRTALHLAVLGGNKDVVRSLALESKHSLNFKDRLGRTPLHFAAAKGDESIARLLLAEPGCNKEDKDNKGWTSLHLAAYNGHEDIVRLLAAKLGCNKETRDNKGWTPMHLAACNGQEGIVRLFAAELGCHKETRDNKGWTPLHSVAVSGDDNIVKLLVTELGCDKEAKDDEGWNSLQLADLNGHEDIVKLLSNAGLE